MRKPNIVISGFLVLGLFTCASASVVAAKTQVRSLAVDGDPLRLELIWNEAVDLDLFVTGPAGETIYYGNKQSKNGNKVVEESNCKSLVAQPKFLREVVIIPSAQRGKYRVSVDFIFHCGTGLEKADAELILFNDLTSDQLSDQKIVVRRQFLNTVAMEFEVGEK